MKKITLLKTLLVGLLVCGATSAWADKVTIYGRAVTEDAQNGYTAWSSSDIGNGNWGGNAWFSENEGIKMNGTGNRNTSNSFTITENSLLTIDFAFNTGINTGNASNYTVYRVGEDIQIWFNQQNQQGKVIINENETIITNACKKDVNRNNDLWTIHMEINTANDQLTAMTLSGRDGGTKNASFSLAEAVTLSHNITTSLSVSFSINRAAGSLDTYLTSLRIQEEEQIVTNVNYTINYQLEGTTVKTVAASSVVGATITADIAIDGTEDGYEGKHYLITDTSAPSLTLDINAATNVLNVPVRLPYTATLSVTKEIAGIAQAPVVTNLVETDSKVCAWSYAYPMYVEKDGVYYIADQIETFGESGTFTDGQTINKTVKYTNPDYTVVYFGEPNEVAGNNFAYSNGSTGFITGGISYAKCPIIKLTLPAGEYTVISKVTGNPNRNFVIGKFTDTTVFPEVLVAITTNGDVNETITLTETTPISISGKDQGGGKFNQSADIDYVLVKSSTEIIAVTTGNNGYVTFASKKAVDLAGTGLKAYTGKINDEKTAVNFAEVSGTTIPANTGVLLEGEASMTYFLSVASSASSLSDNDFKVGAGSVITVSGGETYFAMVKDSTPLTFGKVDPAAVAIPANKAYLAVANANAARLAVSFGGETTGIKAVENTENGKAIYNLNGQRVVKAQKGVYIVNGKKTIVK